MVELAALFPTDEKAEAREAGLYDIIFAPCEADPELRCYLLLDAAASADIPTCLAGFNSGARCLFDGQVQDELGDVAPWLVEVTRHQAVTSWFVEEGLGQNWGVIIQSRLELPKLKTRLKRFLRVEDDSGESLFFKFYRPRNLNSVLPVFEADQRASFFKGIEAYFAEEYGNHDLLRRHTPDGVADGEVLDLVQTGKPLLIGSSDPDEEARVLLSRLYSEA